MSGAITKASRLPQFIIEDHPKFRAFLEAYYRWQEEEGADLGLEAMKLANDIDLAPSSLLEGYKRSYASNMPEMKGDFRLFAKHLKEFYRLKGTPESYRLFYHGVFQAKVGVEFPRKYLFKPSDGDWNQKQTMMVKSSDNLFALKGERLSGFTIVDVVRVGDNFLLHIEDIEDVDNVPAVNETLSEHGVTMTVQGQWAVDRVESTPSFTDGQIIENDNLIFRVDKVGYSGIVSLDITHGGSGYEKDQVITATATKGQGSGFKAIIEAVDPTGAITKVKITRSGFGFDNEGVVFHVEGKGTGAEFTPTFEKQFRQIKHLSIIRNGLANAPETTKTLDDGTKIHLKAVPLVRVQSFQNPRSLPSSKTATIHDSNRYQEYSYELVSSAETKMQEQSIRSLLHIAGLKMFMTTLVEGESMV